MIRPKKSLGQNYLIDKNVIKKILDLALIKENNIVEIGPGTGNLTDEIIKIKPKNLLLVEKDDQLCDLLIKKHSQNTIIKIFNEDILNFALENKMIDKSIVIGNLPYNISTQILVKLIKFKEWPPNYKKVIFMFQKEVAEKILAKEKTSKYGRITVISNWRLKVVNHFHVSKNCFFPKPKIDSTVVVFEPITNNKYKINNISNLELITRVLFSNTRKMINKSFSKLFKDSVSCAKKLNINLTYRPNQLSDDEFYKITEKFERLGVKISL